MKKAIIFIIILGFSFPVYGYELDDYDRDLRPRNMEVVLGFVEYSDCERDVEKYDELYKESESKMNEAIAKLAPPETYYRKLNEQRHEKRMAKVEKYWEDQFDDCIERAKYHGYEYKTSVSETQLQKELKEQIKQLLLLIEILTQLKN